MSNLETFPNPWSYYTPFFEEWKQKMCEFQKIGVFAMKSTCNLVIFTNPARLKNTLRAARSPGTLGVGRIHPGAPHRFHAKNSGKSVPPPCRGGGRCPLSGTLQFSGKIPGESVTFQTAAAPRRRRICRSGPVFSNGAARLSKNYKKQLCDRAAGEE